MDRNKSQAARKIGDQPQGIRPANETQDQPQNDYEHPPQSDKGESLDDRIAPPEIGGAVIPKRTRHRKAKAVVST